MSGLHVIPLAFVMVAGPQILSAVFLATSDRWRANSVAFVGGAALSVTAMTSLAYVLGREQSNGGSTRSTELHLLIAILLVAAMAHTYRTRKRTATPSWMAKLEEATPRFSLALGALLLGVFPTDIFTSMSVGTYVAAQGDRWVHVLPFVLVTLIFLALPALTVLAFGPQARVWLPKARDWMNSHSWIVAEIVLGIFVALSLSNVSS